MLSKTNYEFVLGPSRLRLMFKTVATEAMCIGDVIEGVSGSCC